MDLIQQLNNLTPEQLQAFKQQLDGLADTSGRSPQRPRQLHDLRLLPTKDDPRPLFIPSAEAPRDGRDLTKTSEYPKLMWHRDSGEEITVYSAAEQRQMADIYNTFAPEQVALAPMDALRLELSAFSAEDLELLLDAQKQARMQTLQDKLAKMPEDALARLLEGVEASDQKTAGKKKSA